MADDGALEIRTYIAEAPAFARPLLKNIRAVARRAEPRLTEEIKWGAPTLCHEGIVCSFVAFKAHVAVWFAKGVLLRDPAKVLLAGTAKTMRSLRYESLADIDEAALADFVRQAAALNEGGVKAKPAKRPVVVPPALKAALAKSPAAKSAFDALPPSCRREYAEHVAGAKREETVARRVEKTIAMLEAGKRLNDAYRG